MNFHAYRCGLVPAGFQPGRLADGGWCLVLVPGGLSLELPNGLGRQLRYGNRYFSRGLRASPAIILNFRGGIPPKALSPKQPGKSPGPMIGGDQIGNPPNMKA